MTNWMKYVPLNIGMILGFLGSLFLLPPNTHFWPVFLVFLAFLGYSNYRLSERLKTPNPVGNRAENLTWVVIVLMLLIFDFLLGRFSS
jgi:hypothetical protein